MMDEASVPARAVPGVPVLSPGLRSDLRAIKIVWKREWLRFVSDRTRIAVAFVQPMMFLFVLGTGLSQVASAGTQGVNLRTFVYPGVLAMAVLFTAIFSAASVADREFGFLREMLVAPVRRASIVGAPPNVDRCMDDWSEDHHDLHTSATLLAAIEPRFTQRYLTWTPYLCGELSPVVTEEQEQALIAAGTIQATGFCYVGERRETSAWR